MDKINYSLKPFAKFVMNITQNSLHFKFPLKYIKGGQCLCRKDPSLLGAEPTRLVSV